MDWASHTRGTGRHIDGTGPCKKMTPGIAIKTIIYVKNIYQARHIIYRILDIWSRVAADCIPGTGSLKPRKQGKDGKVFTKICLNSPARLSTVLFNQIWSRTEVWLAAIPVGRVIHGMKWAGEKWWIRAWVEAGLTCAATSTLRCPTTTVCDLQRQWLSIRGKRVSIKKLGGWPRRQYMYRSFTFSQTLSLNLYVCV